MDRNGTDFKTTEAAEFAKLQQGVAGPWREYAQAYAEAWAAFECVKMKVEAWRQRMMTIALRRMEYRCQQAYQKLQAALHPAIEEYKAKTDCDGPLAIEYEQCAREMAEEQQEPIPY